MPHAVFTTPLGPCAIAWHGDRLTQFSLPDPRRATDERGDATEPPVWVRAIIVRVQRHLAGEFQDFSDLPYDFAAVPSFHQEVLRATLGVKAGCTATYGEIAGAIGQPAAASRAVGAALGANRWPLLIPCHRITGAHGRMTGFSGPGGITTKVRLLALEGAQLLSE